MHIARVNMSELKVELEAPPPEYDLLGGRGLTSTLLAREVDPRVHPLSGENKVVIAPGLLTGSAAPCSGRTSIGTKSPLTGTIKESNVGGTAGQYLAGHGIKALVIEGRPASTGPQVLVINENGPHLVAKPGLAGLGNYATVQALQKEYGSTAAIISTGPAGERRAAVATTAVTDLEGRPSRHAGRGGTGAVLGSKNLKAVVISRPPRPALPPARPEAFKKLAREFARAMVQSKKALSKYGTAVLVNVINQNGGLPTRNFSAGSSENAPAICGERLYELCAARGGATAHPCSRGCAVKCSNVFHGPDGEYITAGLEYETIALLGSNCGLYDLDLIARLDRLCDDLGIDTMEAGVTLGVAMEAGLLPFGDYDAMAEKLKEIAGGNLLGKVLGQGAAVTGRVLGAMRVPVVKGQGLSAYDPRALKGTGVTYATSTMGADHTAGNCLPGRGNVDCHQAEGQVELSHTIQLLSTACDLLGFCIFVGPVPEVIPDLAALASAFKGQTITVDDLVARARQILKTEAGFNAKAGIGPGQHDLPLFFRTEKLPDSGLVFDVPAEELQKLGQWQ